MLGRLKRTALSGVRAVFNNPRIWTLKIREFERADRAEPPAPGGIVFTGSSSIRFWRTLEDDFAPLPVVNRGFGGAQIDQVLHFAPRILPQHRPSLLVFYCGDNDLDALTGKSEEQVVRDFERFDEWMQKELPETRLIFLSIKPSPLRQKRWPLMERVNARLAARCAEDPRLRYVDVATPLFHTDGAPRRDLFRWDGVHLSPRGYEIWAEILRPILREEFAAAASR
jgi:lysophospholipase L1-like esterase